MNFDRNAREVGKDDRFIRGLIGRMRAAHNRVSDVSNAFRTPVDLCSGVRKPEKDWEFSGLGKHPFDHS